MTITIDGKACDCERGEYILEIARRNKIPIPTLCHHEGLPGQACCRVCVVEVETGGWKNIVASCVYPVERECAVYTNNEAVKRQRRVVLSLLRARAPGSDRIKTLCKMYGVPENARLTEKPNEKCILCGLCVRACESLGAGAITTVDRGVNKRIATPYDEPSSDCVGCLSCAGVCPTDAIAFEEDDISRTIWSKKFALIRCERCGEIAGTAEELALAAKRLGSESGKPLCSRCRQKSLADTLAATFGV